MYNIKRVYHCCCLSVNNRLYLYLFQNSESWLKKLQKKKEEKYSKDEKEVMKDFQKIIALKISNKL